jgi:tetratricopeptide (TPR) repeat protein
MLYLNVSNHSKAKENIDKAIELDSSEYLYFANRAMILSGSGEFDCACKDLKIGESMHSRGEQDSDFIDGVIVFKSRFCDSSKVSYYLERGVFEYGKGNFKQAIEFFNIGLVLDSNNLLLAKNKADALAGIGDFEKAICFYTKCLKYPTRLRNELNNYLFYFGEAMSFADQLSFFKANIYSSLGFAQVYNKDTESAMISMKKSNEILINLEDKNSDTLLSDNFQFMGQIFLEEANYGSAKLYFKNSIEFNGNNANSYLGFAQIIMTKNNFYGESSNFEYDQLNNKVVKVRSKKSIKKLLKARAFCTKSLSLDEKLINAYVMRAQVDMFLGKNNPCADANKAFELGYHAVYSLLGLECNIEND